MGDVRYCRLCAVEQAQEDVASVGSVSVNLLRCLLSQAAHCAVHTAHRMAEYGVKGGSCHNTEFQVTTNKDASINHSVLHDE